MADVLRSFCLRSKKTGFTRTIGTRKGVKKMKEKLLRFLKDEEGATAVEYGIMVALIAAVIITAVTSIGDTLNNTFTSVANTIAIP